MSASPGTSAAAPVAGGGSLVPRLEAIRTASATRPATATDRVATSRLSNLLDALSPAARIARGSSVSVDTKNQLITTSRGLRHFAALGSLDEVDDQRHPVEAVALPQPVLEEVGVIAGQLRPGIDLDREPGRPHPRLGHEQQLQARASASDRARRRLAHGDDLR